MTPEDPKPKVNLYFDAARRSQANQLITRLGEAAKYNPDTVGKAYEKASELGVSPFALANDTAFLEDYQKQRDSLAQLQRSPSLMTFIDMDAVHAPLVQDELATLASYHGFLKSSTANPEGTGVGRAIQRFGARMQMPGQQSEMLGAAQALEDAEAGDAAIVADAFQKATGIGEIPEGMDISSYDAALQTINELGLPPAVANNFVLLSQQRLENARQARENPDAFVERGVKAATEFNRLQEVVAGLSMSPRAAAQAQRYQEADGVIEGGLVLLSDPIGTATLLGEVAAEQIPAIAASILASVITRSPGVGTVILSGAAASQKSSELFQRFLDEQNVDLTTREGALAALSDPDLMAEANRRGLQGGLVLAAFEALGQGIAGRVAMGSMLTQGATQIGVQMATGGGGEAAASLAGGFEVDWKDVLLEALAEGVTAPAEIYSARGEVLRRRDAAAREGAETARTVEQINEVVSQTKLRDRSPKAFRRFLQAGQYDRKAIYIDAAALAEATAQSPEQLALLGVTPQKLQSAVEAGGTVAVNMATYMQNVPGRVTSLQNLFVEHGTLRPGALSKAQAEEYQITENPERRAELAEQVVQDAIRDTVRQQIETRVFVQLSRAGKSAPEARAGAALHAAFFDTLGQRVGYENLAERFQLDIRGPASPRPEGEPAARVLQQPVVVPPGTAPDVAELAAKVNAGATPEQLLSDPAMQRVVAEMQALTETVAEDDTTMEFFESRVYVGPAGPIQGFENLMAEIERVEAAYAGEGGVRQERKITILIGAPAAGKSTLAEAMAPEMGARIVDSDDIKKLIPEYAGGIGAMAVHEESSALGKASLDRALQRGDNIILPKVGDNPAKMRQLIQKLQAEGYTVDLANMALPPEEAFSRMVRRFIQTGRLIPPEYALNAATKPAQTYEILKQEGVADGYANFDTNVPFGQPARVLEDRRAGRPDGGSVPEGQQAAGRAGEEPVPEQGQLRILKQSGVARREPETVGRLTGVEMPTNLASASQLALEQQFKTGRDLKLALQEIARATHGEALLALDDETRAKIADFIFEDALEAVQDNQNAIGWYDSAVTRAKTELAKLYPELAEGGEAEFAFIWALAVTSNGLKVDKNFELAAQAYDVWKSTGRFPKKIGVGTAAKQIDAGLEQYHRLLDIFGGDWQAARDFMVAERPVREIEATTGIAISGEGKGEVVRGAAILGPKIGNGFFSNLYGYFDGLTMDRWLMRSVGRWRGSLIYINEEMIAKKRVETSEFAAALTDAELEFLNGFFNGGPVQLSRTMTDEQIDLLAADGAKRSMDKGWRSRFSAAAGGKGDTLRKILNGLAKYIDGQVEAPAGAKERTFIRGAFRDALARLQQESGLERLTMADLQALLWYPEKLLYESAKKKPGEEIKSYEDDEAPDYGNAARNLVRNRLGQDGGGAAAGRGAAGAGSRADEGRRLAQSGPRLRGGDGGLVAFRGREIRPVAVFGSDARPVYEVDDPALFGELIREAKAALGPVGAQVTAYDDYSGKRLFLFDDGASGFALDGEDIISVFSSPDSQRGVVETMMPVAVAEGGRRLDAFNTFLPKVYARAGFKAVARLAFNRDYAPDGWDYDFFAKNFGESDPDIAFMVYDPQQASADTDNVVDDYDAGMAAQQAALGEPARAARQADLTGTKVVDSQGRPLLVKHGTSTQFDVPRPFTQFTPNDRISREFGDRTVSAYLNIQNPADLRALRLSPSDPNINEKLKDLQAQGYDGAFYRDDVWIPFSSDQIVIALKQGERGEIRIPTNGVVSGTTVIELFKSGDESTFLHESGHFFLEIFQQLAQDRDAPQQVKDDMEAINAFLGREPGDTSTFTTEQQEKWAEAFEVYLMEGTAPSPALKSAFRKFALWLTRLYKRATAIGAQPTPEIRAVMDRMLATDNEIELARAENDAQALFSEIPPGMTAAEWEPYVRLVEKEEAETHGRALARAMAKIRRRRTAEYKRRKKQLAEETRAALREERVYRLIDGLGNKGFGPSARLNKADLIQMFGEQVLQDLSRKRHGTVTNLYIDDGTPIEMVAETFGYDSVVEMVNDLRAARPIDEAVEAEIERRLDDELGNPDDEVDIREEAEAALKNGFAMERVAREVAALERAAGGTSGPNRWQQQNAAARAEAERQIDNSVVRDILGYRQYLRASQKAARDAQRALASVVRAADGTVSSGSREALKTAAEAKRRQLLNDHMYRIARERARKIEAARKRFQRMQKRSIRQNIGAPFVDVIDTLLDQYNFRQVPISEVRRRASIIELHQQVINENRGAELAIPVDVLSRTESVHYTMLTGAQIEGVIDAIDNIAHMGRATQKQIAADEAFDLKTALDAIEERADRNLKDNPPARSVSERSSWRDLGRQFVLHVLNADSILRDIDGDETALGPAYRAIKEGIDKAVGRADARRQRAAEQIAEIYRRNLGGYKGVAKLRAEKRVYEGLGTEPLSRLDLLSMALNSGNEANFERLTNPNAKNTFDANAVRAVLVRELTEAEWRFVQDVWDYLDSYWPELSAQERKYTGVTPKKVQARLMIDGAPSFVTGGYYPIRYDSGIAGNVDDVERAQLATEGTVGVFGKAQTNQGHAKERLRSTGRPLALDLGIIDTHVYNVIHDIELRGPVRDAARIIWSQRFSDMLIEKGRGEDLRALKAWVQDVAVGDRVGAYGMSRWFRWMRGGFTLSAIGFKVSTIMIQPLGLTQSLVQVGYADMVRGYSTYVKQGPARMHQFALSKSTIMQERIRTFDKDISEITGEVGQGQALQRGYQRVLNSYMIPYAYMGMQHMQYWVVDLPTWVASYEKALRAGETEANAITIADRDVRIAQGSGLMSDRGMLERGRVSPEGTPTEVARLFTVLGSYMFGKFNLAYRRTRGTDFKNPAAVAKLTVDLMTLFVVEAMLVYLLRNGWPDEEDDEPPLPLIAAREGFHTALGTMPVLRDVSSALRGYGGGAAYETYVGAFGDLISAGGDLVTGEPDRGTVQGLLGFGGTVFFLPSGQINSMLDALFTKDFEIEDDALLNLLGSLTGLPIGGEDES